MDRSLRRSTLLVSACVLLLLAAMAPRPASARSTFFASRCASCHSNDTVSCNACHHHSGGTLSASANHTQYNPGDPVTITLNGGEEHGWIRALLYDQSNSEIDRRTGPTGTGDDSQGNAVTFPVTLHGNAPMTPGNYVWQAAWFGSINNSSPPHGEERINVTIRVVQDPTAVPGGPGHLLATWGKLKALLK